MFPEPEPRPARTAVMVDQLVSSDGVDPGGHQLSAVKGGALGVDRDQSLLHQILRLPQIRLQPTAKIRLQTRMKPLQKTPVGGRVAIKRAQHQRL